METTRYTRTAIALHWLIAVAVIANVALAWIWPYLADERVRPVVDAHKSLGVTVLGLAIMRLLWRFGHRPPPLPKGYALWEVRTSKVTHALLYVLIFAMPLSGWIMDSAWKDAATHPMAWFGMFQWPRIGFIMNLDPVVREQVHGIFGETHELLAKLLYLLFALHVAGALKHQFIDGDRELQRILP